MAQVKREMEASSEAPGGKRAKTSSVGLTEDRLKTLEADLTKVIKFAREFAADQSEIKSEAGEEVKLEKNAEGESFIACSKAKRITVRKFKSSKFVDIREFYEAGGEMKPGKKGITLKVEELQLLKKALPAIEKALEELK